MSNPLNEPSNSLVPPTPPPPGAEAAGTPDPDQPKPESGGLRAKVLASPVTARRPVIN